MRVEKELDPKRIALVVRYLDAKQMELLERAEMLAARAAELSEEAQKLYNEARLMQGYIAEVCTLYAERKAGVDDHTVSW